MKERKLTTMTQGSEIRRIIDFAVPMFFCSVFQQLYSTVDAAIVGRFAGTQGLAAIGVTGQIIILAVSIGVGLMLGISIAVSENYGAGNLEKVRQVVVISVFVVLVTWILKVIVGVFLAEPILRAVHTPDEVLADAVLYLKIVFGGGLFTYAYSMCIYLLRACGDGNRPLIFLAFSCLSNIALDLAFVKYLEMGVAGAAVGTVIAESLATLMCVVYIKKKMSFLWVGREDFYNTKKDLTFYVLKLSLPTCLQIGAVSFCSILVQSVINRYGTVVVAGYAAAVKLEQVVNMIITALTGALNTFTAQNRGAGYFDRIGQGSRMVNRLMIVLTLAVSLFIFLTGKFLLGLFVSDADGAQVVSEGYFYLQITCGFYIILGLEQAYMAVLRGMADVLMPLVIGGIQIGANIAAILLLEPFMGKSGIWWSVVISWTLSLHAAKIRLRRYDWEANQ